MDKLNKTIADVANILDNLILLRSILETGDCNNCNNRNCAFKPSLGQMVRYNCPWYEGHTGKKREEGD